MGAVRLIGDPGQNKSGVDMQCVNIKSDAWALRWPSFILTTSMDGVDTGTGNPLTPHSSPVVRCKGRVFGDHVIEHPRLSNSLECVWVELVRSPTL